MAEELTRDTRSCECRQCGTSALIRDWSCGCRTVTLINDRPRCAGCTDFSALGYDCGEGGHVRSHGAPARNRNADEPHEQQRETAPRSYTSSGNVGGGGRLLSGGGSSAGSGGGLAGLALIIGIYVMLFEERPPPVPEPNHLPVGELIDQALANPASLASIPSYRMTAAEYGLAHSFVRYDTPRRMIAPGQPGIRWHVPMHAGPTTLTAKLGELAYFEELTAYGQVKGPDGRTWEVVARGDGTKGFVVQRELREAGSVPDAQSERATYSLDESEAKSRVAALEAEVRTAERAVYASLPEGKQVDFGLERASWHTNTIMIGCGTDVYCKIKGYRKRLQSLRQFPTADRTSGSTASPAGTYKTSPPPNSGTGELRENYGGRFASDGSRGGLNSAGSAEAPEERPVEEACVWFNDRKVCSEGTGQ